MILNGLGFTSLNLLLAFAAGKRWFFPNNTLMDVMVPWILMWCDKASGPLIQLFLKVLFFLPNALQLTVFCGTVYFSIDLWESEKCFFLCGVRRRNLVLLKHERTHKWDRLLIVSSVSLWPCRNHLNFTLLLIPRFCRRFFQQANKVAVNIIF